MIILLIFSFLAGIVTILSPCILPILPLVLSSSVTGGKRRPLGVVTGFILSFSFFTLFLTAIVKSFGISPQILRYLAVAIVLGFGISLLIPKFQSLLEQFFVKFARFTPKTNNQKQGFWGGMFVGLGIGLVWTPCVGPILASVISLALTGTVTLSSFFVVLAYSLGTAIPMFAIVYGGRTLLDRLPWLTRNTVIIQKIFGFLMILTALAIAFNFDRNFQTFILDKFPKYGAGLTALEDNNLVKNQINNLKDEDEMKINLLAPAPEIIAGGEWFNSEPLTINSLKGKVVLIDFWTYTCINCIRTLPYVEGWYEKYKDNGLVVIGVHTPEFEFEKEAKNVKKAIADFGLTYPVVQDNNYATWKAFNNHYWPAKYLINKDGEIVYTHFGEGDYDKTEKIIQDYLNQAGSKINEKIDNPEYAIESKTPELYLGYGRSEFMANRSQLVRDKQSQYQLPDSVPLNYFAFGGKWMIGQQYAQGFTGSSLLLNYDAKNVFLVMRPKDGTPGNVKVFLDEKQVKEIEVDTDKLYTLIEEKVSGKHILKLEFEDVNIEIYAFTFG